MADEKMSDTRGDEELPSSRAVPVSAEPEVPITDLITDDFIQRQTDFPDAGTFWLAAGFGGVPTATELNRLDSEEFDEFVRESTPFPGALEFLLMARAEAEGVIGGGAEKAGREEEEG